MQKKKNVQLEMVIILSNEIWNRVCVYIYIYRHKHRELNREITSQ